MAEAERRPGKTPLRKQPEIEEVEEENQSQNQDACVTNMIDTSRVSTNNGEEDGAASEHGATCLPLAANGGGMAGLESSDTTPGHHDMTPDLQPMPSTDLSSTPETTRKDRPLRMNHSFSSKAKPLMRGTAIDECVPTPEVKVITTPAPDNDDSPYEFINTHVPVPLLGQDGCMGRSVLQKNGSLSSDAGTSICSLSRESSVEKIYKDSSGVDLEEFIKKTLLKSKKDKQMLLSLEKDFKMFVESTDQHYQLAEMCSYDRMICHRVAAFYGMDHNIDKSGKSVIVSKTKFTRIPTFCCEDYIRTVEPDDSGCENKQMRLLKKPASMEERNYFFQSRAGDKEKFSSHRTKSLEERQRHYDEKRKIIFGAASEEAQGLPVIDHVPSSNKRLSSRDWSSTDSSGYVSEDGSRLRRSMMAKSNSYGGKPTIHLSPNTRTCSLSKADSITSGSYESAPVRTKQASPENSQSPISGSGRSSADVNSPSQGNMGCGTGPPYTVLVATDINTIPPGSMVVNPHTLQPHTNADGSLYRYNPSDPNSFPPGCQGAGG
ncbi:hypothetical protein ACOMHN_030265 [Nucella lapillus]